MQHILALLLLATVGVQAGILEWAENKVNKRAATVCEPLSLMAAPLSVNPRSVSLCYRKHGVR